MQMSAHHDRYSDIMDTTLTLLKALDLLTILAGRAVSMKVPELSQALNQPRTNVIRLLRTLELYGFVVREKYLWRITPAFFAWATPAGRHQALRRQYRRVLEAVAERTGELVTLGVHEGNGVIHIDYIESDRLIRIVASPETRYTLRHGSMGKLALSRRSDLVAKIREARFQMELAEIRRTGVAWNREETVRGMIALACPGFTNNPTEPMLSVAWPASRFSERKAREAVRAIKDALGEL